MNYKTKLIGELQVLENFSPEYTAELKLLSKRIRNDMWRADNEEILLKILNKINFVYKVMCDAKSCFDLSFIIEYIKILEKYGVLVCPDLKPEYYNNLIDDIQLEHARVIIEQQWIDITASEDGLKSFEQIFDDLFTNCIKLHKDKFFHPLKDTDVLCRVVQGTPPYNKERFIPKIAVCNNRWNPPGRAFLYLSFSTKQQEYDEHMSVNEYICLEEFKAKKGQIYHFCNFKPTREGVIFDLSYNDVSMQKIKNIAYKHIESIQANILEEIMSDQQSLDKYQNNKHKLKQSIKKLQNKYSIDKKIIEESYAKQYLKMVCSCIYKKVDETDENKKAIAYKSFHALALYLESKGVTGIIYPCTRTNKIKGKNLVLFNKYDAEPIESSIRKFVY